MKIRNINPDFGMGVEFSSVAEMEAAIRELEKLNGGEWMPVDGLREGRDYEIVRHNTVTTASLSPTKRRNSMKDVSIFQGWKEFHGSDGQIRLVDNGGVWGVYKHDGESYVFAGNIEKRNRETNLALYKRAIEMTEEE